MFPNFMQKLIWKIIPAMVPVMLSSIVWLMPDFFEPGSFINFSDVMFPKSPYFSLKEYLYLWVPGGNNGLGEVFFYTAMLPAYLLVYLLSIIGIPLWVLNRLWVVIPLAMIGWGTYYFYLSFSAGRYSRVGGLICCMCAMLAPLTDIFPLQAISLSGFPLVMGSCVKGVKDSGGTRLIHVGCFALGVLLLSFSPRYLYLAIIVVGVFILMVNCCEKKMSLKQGAYFFKAGTLGLLVCAYFIVPLLWLFLYSEGNVVKYVYQATSKEYQTGLDLWFAYKTWANPLFVFRLFFNNPYNAATGFLSSTPISALLLVVPCFAFSSLLISRKWGMIYFGSIAILLISFCVSPGFAVLTKIFLFLWNNLFGWNMLKSPGFFLALVPLFYGTLCGATTERLLEKIDEAKTGWFSLRCKNGVKIGIVASLVVCIMFVSGGPLVIGKTHEKGIWGDVIFPNHCPPIKVPSAYFGLKNFLLREKDSRVRILGVPDSMGGYYPYIWWHYWNAPEVINLVSEAQMVGSGFCASEGWVNRLRKKLECRETVFEGAKLMYLFGIKYVLVHKDIYSIRGTYEPNKGSKRILENLLLHEKNFKLLMDNPFFSFFRVYTEG